MPVCVFLLFFYSATFLVCVCLCISFCVSAHVSSLVGRIFPLFVCSSSCSSVSVYVPSPVFSTYNACLYISLRDGLSANLCISLSMFVFMCPSVSLHRSVHLHEPPDLSSSHTFFPSLCVAPCPFALLFVLLPLFLCLSVGLFVCPL